MQNDEKNHPGKTYSGTTDWANKDANKDSAARSSSESKEAPAESSASNTSEALEAIQKQFQSVKGEVVELARMVRGGAQATVASAVGRADDARVDTVDRAKELEDEAAAWIRDRPLQSALISMGVGAVLWSLLRRS